MPTSDVPLGREGNAPEGDRLFEAAYDELRRRARALLRRERSGHTLQTTALVHEAYAKLAGEGAPQWKGRTHFCRVAARAMRQVLIDWARDHAAKKRGGEAPGGGQRWRRIDLTRADAIGLLQAEERAAFLLDLDAALERLAVQWPRRAQAVELSYFAGLPQWEIADVLEITEKTVQRDLKKARAWLQHELGDEYYRSEESA